MAKKLLSLVLVTVITLLCFSGCKKKTEPDSMDFKAEAQKEITSQNMSDELSKMENEIKQDANSK